MEFDKIPMEHSLWKGLGSAPSTSLINQQRIPLQVGPYEGERYSLDMIGLNQGEMMTFNRL